MSPLAIFPSPHSAVARAALAGISDPFVSGFASPLFDVSTTLGAGFRGASRGIRKGGGWAHQKGVDFGICHALSFPRLHRVIQLVIPLYFSIEAPMEQLELRLLCRLEGPSVVPPHAIKACATYREAVKLCWSLRRLKKMTQAELAREASLYAPHVTCYLHDGKRIRDLPGWAVKGMEAVCGNTAITQWHNAQAGLTVIEEMQLLRAAA